MPLPLHRSFATIALTLWVCSATAWAADAADVVFRDQVAQILEKHCVECHGKDEPELGLNLSTREALLFGSLSGRVVTPGKSKTSLLLQLTAKGATPHMPPEGQLSADEIAVLAKWIDGMKDVTLPARAQPAAKSNHWAYQPMVSTAVPQVKQPEWVRSPMDAFVMARLEAAGLTPSPQATKSELLRRVTLDLIGLPPSPEEVSAFLADDSADAYEKVVDRLLASPHYGERWGRHWLDLARYADSGGYHDDIDRPHAWRYRDYVIRSLNEDKPYGQFISEQIAGDEAAQAEPQKMVATGFCRNGPSNENNMGVDQEKYRLDQLDDVISTTSLVFLGQTIGCARCHDHKFDPITQVEYYRFLAIFDNTVKKDVAIDAAGMPNRKAKPESGKPGMMIMTETAPTAKPTFLLWRGDVNNRGDEVPPGVPASFTSSEVSFAAPTKGAETTGRRKQLAQWLASPENPLTWRVMANRVWQHHFGRGLVATPSNFGTSGEKPTHPELLDWLSLELVKHEGRLKPIHRLILTSNTYRQASRHRPEGAARDSQNLLLWRMNKQRLESEIIRDATLAVAGTLNLEAGGPGIKPRIPEAMLVSSQRNKWPSVKTEGPEHWRRSVYIYVKRQLPFPMLELFDTPNSAQSCDRRDASVVPTQALVLMNDEFMQDQAGYFADRVLKAEGDDERAQVRSAMLRALGREPTETRLAQAMAFVDSQETRHGEREKDSVKAHRLALLDLCHVLLNSNEFVFVD